jgi:hypothetical protein
MECEAALVSTIRVKTPPGATGPSSDVKLRSGA